MAANTEFEQEFEGIVKAEARGARGDRVRLGTHHCTVRAARFFRSRDGASNVPVCVIELTVVKTLKPGNVGTNLTKEETAAGMAPFSMDVPHQPGETVSIVWKKSGKAAQMFDGNVNGFLVFAKASIHNMIKAYKEMGLEQDAKEATEFYTGLGLDLAEDKKAALTKTEAAAIFGEAQAVQGLDIKVQANRVLTRDKNPINAYAFDPLSTQEWAAMGMTSQAEAA